MLISDPHVVIASRAAELRAAREAAADPESPSDDELEPDLSGEDTNPVDEASAISETGFDADGPWPLPAGEGEGEEAVDHVLTTETDMVSEQEPADTLRGIRDANGTAPRSPQKVSRTRNISLTDAYGDPAAQ
ncbi:hypothetical protein [Leucobacter sp. cx-169]|uniref:hypothetical protein n=1 Tax=Leucobacter sp. cx-169 TaxID=2770549 RepID=UPI00165E54FE|nr:hypothetical protein [Leucobacter sp. cx-169]MBC9927279.1 hypothetical protein [Leucobacter sp. cx-169]